jgi:hypothetical protein
MSEAPVQRNTRQTRTAQPKSELAAPTSAPQKRKLPASEDTENGKSKKPRLSPVPEHTPVKSSATTISEPAKQFGVYQHYDLSDPASSDIELVGTAPAFSTAYSKLCDHASGEIGSHPTWGATYTRTLQNVYEILDPDNAVRTRYSIDTVMPYEDGWKREREWLAQDYLDRPDEHWGVFVDINHSPSSPTMKEENFFLGGFTCLGEAKNAMRVSCSVYLEQYPNVRMMDRSLELVDEKGGVRRRYRIVKGRYVQGRFVREGDWVEKEMGGLARGEEVDWEVRKSDVKRLPTPTPTSTPAPEEPLPIAATPTPEEPTVVPEEPVPALATPSLKESELAIPKEPTPAREEPAPTPEEPSSAPEKATPAPEESTPALEEPTLATPVPATPALATPAPEEPTSATEEPTPATATAPATPASDELTTTLTPTPTPAPEGPIPAVATSAPLKPILEEPAPTTSAPTSKIEEDSEPELSPEPETKNWCTCHTPDDGTFMICCDNKSCPIQWYHGRCIGLTRSPRGKWLCATCKPEKKTTKAKTTAVKRETKAKEGRVEKTTATAKKSPKGGRKKKNA